jgi:hypothetical protein
MRTARLGLPLAALIAIGCSETPPSAPSTTTSKEGAGIGAKPNPTTPVGGTTKPLKPGNPTGPTGVVD